MLIGETIALGVALSWTATALFAEVASKRLGSLPFNVLRMTLSLCLLLLTLWLTMGVPWPRYADAATWRWLLLSGVVGYVVGDYCLMQGYIIIGSRFGQLLMTLSAPTAALTALLLLGEGMKTLSIVGMVVTLSGIALSILGRQGNHSIGLRLPPKGIAYGAMAGICQGVGLVLSKVGLQRYDASLSALAIDPHLIPEEAILPLPLFLSIPFAATMIRATIGLVGFFALLMIQSRDGLMRLRDALHDSRAIWCVVGSTIFGPFIGVSMSLLATQYTSAGVAQTLFALTPVLIIAPAAWLFKQKVRPQEVVGAIISVIGASLFFV